MTEQVDKLVVFAGKYTEAKFGELDIPVFPQTEHMSVDLVNSKNAIQPLRYKTGDIVIQELQGDVAEKPVFDMVFQLFGTPENVEASKKAIGDWAKAWVPTLEAANVHLAQRYLYSDNPKYKKGGEEYVEGGVLRVLWIRLYNNADFDCTEHPEFLGGEPIGMYHCPVCNDMQMAGMPHVKDEE